MPLFHHAIAVRTTQLALRRPSATETALARTRKEPWYERLGPLTRFGHYAIAHAAPHKAQLILAAAAQASSYADTVRANIKRLRDAQEDSEGARPRITIEEEIVTGIREAFLKDDHRSLSSTFYLLYCQLEAEGFESIIKNLDQHLLESFMQFCELNADKLKPLSDEEWLTGLSLLEKPVVMIGLSASHVHVVEEGHFVLRQWLQQRLFVPRLLAFVDWLEQNAPADLFGDKKADAIAYLRHRTAGCAHSVEELVDALVASGDRFFAPAELDPKYLAAHRKARILLLVSQAHATHPFEFQMSADILTELIDPALREQLDINLEQWAAESASLHKKAEQFLNALVDVFHETPGEFFLDLSGDTITLADPTAMALDVWVRQRLEPPANPRRLLLRINYNTWELDQNTGALRPAYPPVTPQPRAALPVHRQLVSKAGKDFSTPDESPDGSWWFNRPDGDNKDQHTHFIRSEAGLKPVSISSGRLYSPIFAPNSQCLLARSNSHSNIVWLVYKNEQTQQVILPKDVVCNPTNFSPNSLWLLWKTYDNSISMIITREGRYYILEHENFSRGIEFSPNGAWGVLRSKKDSAELSVVTPNWESVRSRRADSRITQLRFEPAGRYALLLTESGQAYMLTADDIKPIARGELLGCGILMEG